MKRMETPGAKQRSSALRDACAALALYVAMLGALIAPVLPRLADETIARGSDRFVFLWDLWWAGRTVLAGENPYFSDLVYAPYGAPLVFHTLALLPSTLGAGLAKLLGPTLAFNLEALSAMLLAGIGGYAFCRALPGARRAAWLGGAVLMLAPFTTGKLDAGWLNMLPVGLLGLFAAALIRATEPRELALRGARWWLAATSAALVFTSEHLSIFAVNLALGIGLWRLACAPSFATLRGVVRASWPSALAVAPYVAVVVYYATHFDLSPPARPPSSSFFPEPLCYLLPFHPTSIHAAWIDRLGFSSELRQYDLTCYVGLAVFPLALAGLVRARASQAARLCLGLLAFFLVISLGPFLIENREYVRVLGHRVPLPGLLFAKLPVLAAVAQPGRYMAIVYLAIAAGVAFFAASPPRFLSRALGRFSGAALLALIALDYGIVVHARPLPAVPRDLPREGLVLARANHIAEPFYFQIFDRRPLIAGPLSRPVPYALDRYRADPGLACWHFPAEQAPCDWSRFSAALDELDVTGAWLRREDEARAAQLVAAGFQRGISMGPFDFWNRPSRRIAAAH